MAPEACDNTWLGNVRSPRHDVSLSQHLLPVAQMAEVLEWEQVLLRSQEVRFKHPALPQYCQEPRKDSCAHVMHRP